MGNSGFRRRGHRRLWLWIRGWRRWWTRIDHLELSGSKLSAEISNSGPPRVVNFLGTAGATTAPADTGRTLVTRSLEDGVRLPHVELNAGDLWPENDGMMTYSSPTLYSEKWWVGDNAPGKDWVHFAPADFPVDMAQFIAPSVIVLNNVDAPSLGRAAISRIDKYVSYLDGTLVIVGGDHTYVAGSYFNTQLEYMSPLGMWPPVPNRQWVLLVDGSGSMARRVGKSTLYQRAAAC